MPFFKEIQFFKERDIKEADYADIANCLTYEYKNTNQTLFEYGTIIFQKWLCIGSYGNNFYIIL